MPNVVGNHLPYYVILARTCFIKNVLIMKNPIFLKISELFSYKMMLKKDQFFLAVLYN